jgi:uncharacterized protein (TIGR02421 family)
MPETSTSDVRSDEVVARFRGDGGVRAAVGDGELVVDRPLPFLFVHRTTRSDPYTAELLLAESSYFIAAADHDSARVRELILALAEAGSERFGAFLVLELWSEEGALAGPHGAGGPAGAGPAGTMRGFGQGGPLRYLLRCPETEATGTSAALLEALEELASVHGATVDVEVEPGPRRGPEPLPPLLDIPDCHRLGVLYLGLRLPPLLRDPDSGRPYPLYLRRYRGALSQALRRAAHAFAQVQTDADLSGYAALGPRRVGDEVWRADAELARVERSYRLLLLVSPTNQDEAWRRFRAAGYEREPTFHYRLLPVDPALLKRRLYAIELESIPDPALGYLLHEKRDEIDKQISLLGERQTANFLSGSRRLFGRATPALVAEALALLDALPPQRGEGGGRVVDAVGYLTRARQEVAAYARAGVEVPEPQLRSDIVGLMVSDGVHLVGETLRLDPGRVEALIHHEVGTHVLTYVNGCAQPLVQLATGLARYDETQEGLAVLAEYIAGGLTAARLRLLAARVLAVAAVEGGATFLDTFRLLHGEHGFGRGTAFDIAARVHQSGGFTRDMIYLRGLLRLLHLLGEGTDLEDLYLGKFADRHLPVLDELRQRGVLRPPPLRPRFLDLPEAAARIARLRDGLTLLDLAREAA